MSLVENALRGDVFAAFLGVGGRHLFRTAWMLSVGFQIYFAHRSKNTAIWLGVWVAKRSSQYSAGKSIVIPSHMPDTS